MHSVASIALSRKIADESVVLLKNENGLLPLDADKLHSIAVIGPNAAQVQFGDYTWSRDNKDGVTPLAGLQKLLGSKVAIHYAPGCSMMSEDTSLIPEAVAAAQKSEVALVFCGSSSASLARDYSNTNCGEGFDLHDLNLTGAQGELIKAVYATGKPVVLVLVSGKPFTIAWEKEHIPAILVQWYAGEQAGNSIADVLFGKVNPSGKLTFSFPQSVGHLPAYYNHLPSDKGFYKKPGSYQKPGRDYVFSSPASLWAFGYGLSYTSFSMKDMQVSVREDSVFVKAEILNTGKRAGQEVVQLYVRDLVSSVVTPIKQLKAFAKVELQPGEQRTVLLRFPVAELALTNEAGQRLVESGEFEIQLGNSSDNILLKQTIRIGDSVKKDSGDETATQSKPVGTGKMRTVRGIVRDIQATLVANVSIWSVGQKKEIGKTNKKGEYEIQAASDDILIFSGKGYLKQTVPVNHHTDINVKLAYGEDR